MKDLFIFNNIELILAATTAGLFIIQLLYYLVTYARPLKESKRNNTEKKEAQPAVSVMQKTNPKTYGDIYRLY